jgi:hypothetical protein
MDVLEFIATRRGVLRIGFHRLGPNHGMRKWQPTLRHEPCTYCGRRPPTDGRNTVDHVSPRSACKPYPESIGNLVAACTDCNGTKDSKPLLQFLLEQQDEGERRAEHYAAFVRELSSFHGFDEVDGETSLVVQNNVLST